MDVSYNLYPEWDKTFPLSYTQVSLTHALILMMMIMLEMPKHDTIMCSSDFLTFQNIQCLLNSLLVSSFWYMS